MAAPKYRVYRKTKQGKKGTDGTCAVIWENESKGGTFLSLQFHTEDNSEYKQVAFGRPDPNTYFYNVYENKPKEEREKDEAWEEDSEEEEF